jgi:hypothetical protein
MSTTTRTPAALNVDQALALADDLIRALAEHIGDRKETSRLMLRWADTLGAANLGRVSMAAMRTVFAECLSLRTREDWPPGDAYALDVEGTTHE